MTLCIEGGRVLRPDLSVDRAAVLVDQAAGEVRAVGDVAGTGDERLDAAGGLVMPGLVNAHTHAAMTLLRGYSDDKPLDRWLREDVWPAEARMDATAVRAGAELAAVEMLRSGTTAFADMYFEVPAIADAVTAAGLRARLGHAFVTTDRDEPAARADLEESLAVARTLRERDRIRTAVMPHSLTTAEEPYFSEAVTAARELGVPVHCHANETRSEVRPFVEAGQRPLVAAAERGLLADAATPDFLAHCVHLDDAEIDLLATRDAGVVHCPTANMKLASGAAPIPDLLAADVTVGLGTDGAASNNDLDMFGELRQAALLAKLAADDAAAVPAATALRMATTGSGAAAGLPVGQVTAGAPADLIVVDLDTPRLTPATDDALVSHLAYAAVGDDVRHTVVDGAVVMRDRTVTTLDAVAVRETATDQARRIRARAAD